MIKMLTYFKKNMPDIFILMLGIVVLFYCVHVKLANLSFQKLVKSKTELHHKVIELRTENKTLLKQIKLYQTQSDSIQKLIQTNTKNMQQQINNLINLSNDELRKIANE